MSKINLTELEKKVISSLMLEDKVNLNRKLKIIEKKIPFLEKLQDKKYISECIKKIKSNINSNSLLETTEGVYQLQEVIKEKVEKESPSFVIKYPDASNIVKISLIALPGEESVDGSLGTVFLKFKIVLYPKGKKHSELYRDVKRLNKQLSGLGPIVLNKILRKGKSEGKWELLEGTGIWESSLPEFKFAAGKPTFGSVEIALDTNAKSLEELRPNITRFLEEVNDFIPVWFGEGASSEVEEGEEEGDAWEKPDTEFDIEEKEPSIKDIEKIDRSLRLDSVQRNKKRLQIALLKEKIEKATGKKIVLK